MNNFKKITVIKELIEEPKETKSPNWLNKSNFEKNLAIIDSNKFNYNNKIGEFKHINIRDLVNNIRNNTISETSAKKDLNTLNKIKTAEIIKCRKRTPGHKELLNLFNNLLDAILTYKTLESEVQEDKNENKNENYKNKNPKNKKTVLIPK